MAGLIPDSFIEELLGRVDIVEIIERRVPLKKAGREFQARCPFHDEKTPSGTGFRWFGLDVLRGLIVALMALDHASFFIARMHSREFWGTALPHYDTILPFLMRLASHMCAPGFFFLMGAGMSLFSASR